MYDKITNHFSTTLHGIDVHYELYNEEMKNNKPVFVLIHGFLSSTFSFRRLIPLLSREYTVLALDLPPFGKSGKVREFVYSYDNFANIVISLLEKLTFQHNILIGHSMGGQVALYVSRKRPDLVYKKVLLSSSGYLPRAKFPLLHSSYLPWFSTFLKLLLQFQGVSRNLMRVVHDVSLIDDEMMEGYTTPFYDRNIFDALTKMVRDREGDLPVQFLKEITTPTLLIWGEQDRIVPLSIGKRLHNDLPYSTFISYQNTGHLLPEEQPHQIYENIIGFAKG
ncbi:alpha/beta hydrolase [Priestia taiwanensis]|uniref:Hydrolase n=1 Tax=Priestia taiwanensis TaxID=1347902 RepID=A0A917AXJ4_9BACI|nr:alpha/beta hydrolase [Priestia taiwanensis]MBM7364608.1 pimeloyl-ACP methyl ester carboxylesterase [Priestia taiwanensis]GGE80168.1 hydrolase [Priestia taiwanensis]